MGSVQLILSWPGNAQAAISSIVQLFCNKYNLRLIYLMSWRLNSGICVRLVIGLNDFASEFEIAINFCLRKYLRTLSTWAVTDFVDWMKGLFVGCGFEYVWFCALWLWTHLNFLLAFCSFTPGVRCHTPSMTPWGSQTEYCLLSFVSQERDVMSQK